MLFLTELHRRALDLAQNLASSPSAIERVAKQTSPDAARWAFTQWELRRRAETKFARAQEMLFDREALEMATHERLAAYHASRFPEGLPVLDLTAGIGADLAALGRRGPARGFELDPQRAELCRHNLGVAGVESTVEVADALAVEWEAGSAIFADPARRVAGKRLTHADDYAPSPSEILAKAGDRPALLKLSPMLPDAVLEGLGDSLEFVSFHGECREALVSRNLGHEGRWAVRPEEGLRLEASDVDPTEADAARAWIFEADPAAIRAHGLGTLAERHDLLALGDSKGYLTGDDRAIDPWLTAFEVIADHPADLRRTRSALAEAGFGTPVVKARAPGVDVERLRRDLKSTGPEGVVIVYAVGKKLRHAVVRRA